MLIYRYFHSINVPPREQHITSLRISNKSKRNTSSLSVNISIISVGNIFKITFFVCGKVGNVIRIRNYFAKDNIQIIGSANFIHAGRMNCFANEEIK